MLKGGKAGSTGAWEDGDVFWSFSEPPTTLLKLFVCLGAIAAYR